MNQFELISKVKSNIRSIDPNAKIILFGSRARGDSTIHSDWDFLILTSGIVSENLKRQMRDSLIETELEAEEVISSIIYSQVTWNNYKITTLFNNIIKDGVEV